MTDTPSRTQSSDSPQANSVEDSVEDILEGAQPTSASDPNRKEFVLPRFSLQRRITVLMLLATSMVVGVIATTGIPLELFPRGYTAPSLNVRALWSDAPSQEMLDKVALPLEEELSTVSGLANQVTFATTGFSRVFLSFKLGTDMDVAYREVRDRVERAKARMPDDVDRVMIHKQDVAAILSGGYGIGIGLRSRASPEAYDLLIQNEVILPIQRHRRRRHRPRPTASKQKEVLIELDRERTAAAGLNIYALGLEPRSATTSPWPAATSWLGRQEAACSARSPSISDVERRSRTARWLRRCVLRDIATIKYEEPEKTLPGPHRRPSRRSPSDGVQGRRGQRPRRRRPGDGGDRSSCRSQSAHSAASSIVTPFFEPGQDLIRESLRTS